VNAPKHLMILASAGSGKTYALTNRFVELLAVGARPERIVALTFTRKAAGEFFDEILRKLARAAGDAGEAQHLAAEIGHPRLGAADFLGMLRAVTEAMPRLRLGTLDGFFARIVRSFPLELGLAGEFELLQEHVAQRERRAVLRQIFNGAGGLAEARKEFIEAFKRATFGREEKQLGARLDEFLDAHHEVYLAAPEAELWGNPARIWPEGNPWLGARAGPEPAARLRDLLGRRDLPEKQRARWDDFFAALPERSAGILPKAVGYIVKNGLAAWPDLGAEGAGLTVERKKQILSTEEGKALRAVLARIAGDELVRRLETTRGIHAVLRNYDDLYHEAVRRAGKLTFADVQRLLAPEAGARPLTSEAGIEGRIFIDYRLDAGIDHWLLDEFQDTSFGQWSVLRGLIDEVVQDPSGERSIFCVGDVKQAIFAWREGDPRLFGEIFAHYNAALPGVIETDRLVRSWRSGPPVIAMVNAVFGRAAALAEFFPGEAGARWNSDWRAHESALPQRGGQAAWLLAEDEAAAWEQTLRIIQEIDPLRRGLSCAVLVQTNDTAAALADFLRQRGALPAVAESDLRVGTDNPVGAALLALFQAAAHPGDTLAQEHLRMTPLGIILTKEGLDTAEALTRCVLGEIHAKGFEETAAGWVRRLEPHLRPDDGFSRERGGQFTTAARLFDESGSRDVAEFAAFVKQYTVREPESAAVIRVMTVHKSKGLGFDVVVLPDLEGTKLEQRRGGLAVQKNPDRSVAWVLELPNEIFRARDPVLAEHVRAAEMEAAHEAISLLYVAMTRAQRAMYLITVRPGSSASRNYPQLLAHTLGALESPVRIGRQMFTGAWAEGDADWPAGLPRSVITPPRGGEASVLAENEAARGLRRVARRPSDQRAGRVEVSSLFSLEAGGAARHGIVLHALLAEVEWIESGEISAWTTAWRARGVPAAVVAEVIECLRSEALADVFVRRNDRAEVWRERAFEVVLDGSWVSGVFDRVVVERDETGRAARAVVFDFKTDRWPGEKGGAAVVARYGRQLNLYRMVVARLTGLPPARVEGELVFTGQRRRFPVVHSE